MKTEKFLLRLSPYHLTRLTTKTEITFATSPLITADDSSLLWLIKFATQIVKIAVQRLIIELNNDKN